MDSSAPLPAPAADPLPKGTLERLRFLAAGDPEEQVSFEQLAQVLGTQAFGMLLLIVALPCALPMPPGIGTICGVFAVVIALQMLIGRRHLWLPRRLAARRMARRDFQRIVRLAGPWLGRVERLCRPRLAVLTGSLGRVALGAILLVLAVIVVLPIPLGNIAPGIAMLVLAVGLSERDGVVIGIGMTLAAAALALTAWGLLVGGDKVVAWIGHVTGAW